MRQLGLDVLHLETKFICQRRVTSSFEPPGYFRFLTALRSIVYLTPGLDIFLLSTVKTSLFAFSKKHKLKNVSHEVKTRAVFTVELVLLARIPRIFLYRQAKA